MRRRVLVTAIAGAACLLSVSGVAAAAWGTAQVGASGGKAASLQQPSTGTAGSATASSLALSWLAPSGLKPDGYVVLRSTATGGPYSAVAAPSTCSGTIAGTACTDSGLSANTTYYYVLQARSGSSWVGPSSAEFNGKTLVGGPTASITAPPAGASYANNSAMSKNCDAILNNATGICGAFTAGSGVASNGITLVISRTIGAGNAVTYWNGSSWVSSNSTVTAGKVGTSNWLYSLSYNDATSSVSNGTTAHLTATVTATDSNSQSGSATRTFDVTG